MSRKPIPILNYISNEKIEVSVRIAYKEWNQMRRRLAQGRVCCLFENYCDMEYDNYNDPPTKRNRGITSVFLHDNSEYTVGCSCVRLYFKREDLYSLYCSSTNFYMYAGNADYGIWQYGDSEQLPIIGTFCGNAYGEDD